MLRYVFCAQEQPSYDKKQFLGWAKASLCLSQCSPVPFHPENKFTPPSNVCKFYSCDNTVRCPTQEWLKKVLEKLPEDKKDEFKEKSQPAIKFLMSKIKELQL